MSTGRGTCRRSPAPDERIVPACGCRRPRLRRHGRASPRRRRDRGRARRRHRAAVGRAGGHDGPRAARRVPGSRPASSTCRSMAAAMCCSTTRRRRRASRRSRPRTESLARRRFLPTFISDTPDKTSAAIAAVATLVDRDPSVLGIHLEGPFLSPEKPGVHDPARCARPPRRTLQTLTRPRKGAMLVTLAPERVPAGFIAQLDGRGHPRFARTFDGNLRTKRAPPWRKALTGFTHLFNAMRPLASREPGPIAAALESPDAWFGMIVDGDPRRSGDAAPGAARRRASDAGDRCHAAGGGTSTELHARRRGDHGAGRPLRAQQTARLRAPCST